MCMNVCWNMLFYWNVGQFLVKYECDLHQWLRMGKKQL